ncbi:mitochondrial inner membrane protein OXA1-like [Aristolochia californica]|uniref:mitochondrial inner membrane protein OXA1-like n=1 Tax=Aristolochia californica TaxID=171875 RepID=UPI0035D79BFE
MFRRSISTRFTLLASRLHPSFTHVLLPKDDDESRPLPKNTSEPQISDLQARTFYSNYNTCGLSSLYGDWRGFTSPCPLGLSSFSRGYSSNAIGEGTDTIEYMSDVAEVLADKSTEALMTQAPVVSEVAIAAADSAFPVAALQYFIDGVHSFTGLNWWASIMITTILIRTASIPLLINTLKATIKLSQLRPHMEEIKQQMLDSVDPENVAEGQRKMKKLLTEHKVTPFSPMKGLLIQGPLFVSFYLAITNMVEKVPSFKTGGALWFTDLTTVDSMFIFPVVTAFTFLITVELNAQEGMEGNPVAGTVKTFSRGLAVLTVPFTMNFPKAIFCYWVTSNLFSLCYGLVIKRPAVKKLLGIPQFVPPPPTTTQQPSIPFFGGPNSVIGRAKAILEQARSAGSTTSPLSNEQQSKLPGRRVSSSSAVISQRIKNLERTVKRRKKSKKGQ